MRIAIIGTRGIPNFYGGFEQFAEYLSVGLVKAGFDVTVYNSHEHPYKNDEWNGVKIVHRWDLEPRFGTVGQFFYDFNCIHHARKMKYDVVLILGYTSSSIWGMYYPKGNTIITTNMDGLEWKRTKYSPRVRRFLKYAEWLGVKYSDYLIADSIGIQQHLLTSYSKNSVYIPYGATVFENPNYDILAKYQLVKFNYDMLVARLEPENSIEVILDGKALENGQRKFLVIGKHDTPFGAYLKNKYSKISNIVFLGGIYDINILNNLRYFSNLYFHGHTVGGTNPSLLEAMASGALISANNNIFNQSILTTDSFYFDTPEDVAHQLSKINKLDKKYSSFVENNLIKIIDIYSWEIVIQQYINHFEDIYLLRNG